MSIEVKNIPKIKLNKDQKFNLTYKIENNQLIIDLEFSLYRYDLYWKQLDLSLDYIPITVTGIYSNKIKNLKNVLYKTNFNIKWISNKIIINLDNIEVYSYKWIYLNLDTYICIKINEGYFSSKKIDFKIENLSLLKNKDNLYDIKIPIRNRVDNYNLFKNYSALPLFSKNSIKVIFIISIILIISSFSFIYEAKKIIVSIILIIVATILLIRYILQNYILLKINALYSFENKNIYNIWDFLLWRSEIDLKNITISIIASNYEEYKFGKNNNVKIKSKEIILYQDKIDFIPKNSNIQDFIKWSFNVDEIYNNFYPNKIFFDYTKCAKIYIGLELIVSHDDYIDKKISLPTGFLRYENFIQK